MLNLIESFFIGILASSILVWFYNRFLAGLRESYIKKFLSISILPLGCISGVLHLIALEKDWPHISWPALLGAMIVLKALYEYIMRRERNSHIKTEQLTLNSPGMNEPHFLLPVRVGMRIANPINEYDKPELVRFDLKLPHLPESFDGYTICFLTDFHVHPTLTESYFYEIAEIGLEQNTDLMLIGGDFLSRYWHRKKARRLLKALGKHSNIYGVRGNHDFWSFPDYFAQMVEEEWGGRILRNEFVEIPQKNDSILLVGLEDPYIPATPRLIEKLEMSIKSFGNKSVIGLCHTPQTFPHLRNLGCHFSFSGHTHGGQIRLPLFGTTIASSSAPDQLVYGAGRYKGMRTFVSNGIGAFFPFRILCRPQVVVTTLRCPKEN